MVCTTAHGWSENDECGCFGGCQSNAGLDGLCAQIQVYPLIKSHVTASDYVVDLDKQTCSCRIWQSHGFPCAHAINIILAKKEDPQTYAKPFFSSNAYRLTYSEVIFPPAASIDLENPPEFEDNALGMALFIGSESENDTRSNMGDSIQEDGVDKSEDALLPPSTRRPSGHPKKKRIRSSADEGQPTRSFRCSRCKGLGHSSRTCKAAI